MCTHHVVSNCIHRSSALVIGLLILSVCVNVSCSRDDQADDEAAALKEAQALAEAAALKETQALDEAKALKEAQALIEAGGDVNARTDAGEIPLVVAAGHGYAEVVQLLLAAKADVNVRTLRGDTALSIAKEQGDKRIVELLREHGARE